MSRYAAAGFLLVGMVLTGCGSGVRTGIPGAPGSTGSLSNLNGNWKITGTGAATSAPYLYATFALNGSAIFVKGSVTAPCGATTADGGDFDATGNVAADGTFTVAAIARGNIPPPFQLTVSGSAPATAGGSWKAKYTIKGTSGACSVDLSGEDTATLIAPVTGTFSGVVSTIPSAGTWQETVKLTQSATPVSFTANAGGSQSVIPVTGTIDFTGSSCFKHGTSFVDPSQTYVGGSYVFVGFNMDDGSKILWSATAPNGGGGSFNAAGLVQGGACDGVGLSGFLTKQ